MQLWWVQTQYALCAVLCEIGCVVWESVLRVIERELRVCFFNAVASIRVKYFASETAEQMQSWTRIWSFLPPHNALNALIKLNYDSKLMEKKMENMNRRLLGTWKEVPFTFSPFVQWAFFPFSRVSSSYPLCNTIQYSHYSANKTVL